MKFITVLTSIYTKYCNTLRLLAHQIGRQVLQEIKDCGWAYSYY